LRHVLLTCAQITVALAAVVAVIAVLRAVRSPRTAATTLASGLGLTLEFLLAAGLLRLATRPTLMTLGLAALIIAIRRIIGLGLGFAKAALDSA
jgi:uncharacterized membrane protein